MRSVAVPTPRKASGSVLKTTVAQKGHTCKLKMLLQIKNSTCKLKILPANQERIKGQRRHPPYTPYSIGNTPVHASEKCVEHE